MKADEIINEIIKVKEIYNKISKPIKKIKLCDIRIEIDNDIEKDYELEQ